MRIAALSSAWLVGAALAACASRPSAPPRSPPAASAEPAPAPPPPPPPPPEPAVTVDAPERSQPPSTASYEQAMSTPEQLDVNDGRPHLDDDQLRGPMRTIPSKCALPPNAKVTIHTAVQGGRAIGVTVDVRFEHPKPAKPPKKPSRAAAKRAAAAAEREAKTKKAIATCIDHAVRALTWPPSHRRDSFTSEL